MGAVLMLIGCAQPEFDRAKWADARGADPVANPRGAMVEDAERAGLRPGASRATVRELLGLPDASDAAADVYDLGIAPFYHDDQSLVVEYNNQGVVVVVRVHTEG